MKKKTSQLSYGYLALIMIFLYLPILLVIIFSFNEAATGTLWQGFTLTWYGVMFRDESLTHALFVSIRIALFSAFLSAVIGTFGAVSLNRINKKIRLAVVGLSHAPLIIPEVIMGVALLLFLQLTPINFGITAMVIGHSTFCIPYIIVMVNIRLNAIDPSVIEAAQDLGAGQMKVFTTILLPLIAPGIITGVLLAIAMSMDDIIISFFLTGPRDTTLPVKIYSMLKLGVTPEVNALCTILLLFTFAIVGIIQWLTINKKEVN